MMATTINCEFCLKTIRSPTITKTDDSKLKSNNNLLLNYLFHKTVREPAPNRFDFDHPILSFSFTSGEGTNSANIVEKMAFCDDCRINLEKLNSLHEQLEAAKKSVRLQVQKMNNIQLISRMNTGTDNDDVGDTLMESWKKKGQMSGMSMTGSTAGKANILKTLNFLTSLCDEMDSPPLVQIPPPHPVVQSSSKSSSKTRRTGRKTFHSDVPTPSPRQLIPKTIVITKIVQETEINNSPQVFASTSAATVQSSSKVILANNAPSFSAFPGKIDNVQMTVDEETEIFLSPTTKLEVTDPDEIDTIFSTPHVIMPSEVLDNPNFSSAQQFNYCTATSSDFQEKDPLAMDNNVEFSLPGRASPLPAPLQPSPSRYSPIPRPITIFVTTAKKTKKRANLMKPCSVCGKMITSSKMSVHMRVHTGSKPFQCDICNKTFSQSNTFHRHYRIHTGERPFKCDVCDKQFICCDSLKAHKKTWHKP